MQTTYYETHRMIWNKSNVVNLSAYSRDDEDELYYDDIPGEVIPLPRTGRSAQDVRAWALEICASLGVVVMTLSFALNMMLG